MGWGGGGVGVEFGLGGQVCSDGILVDVRDAGGVVVLIGDPVVCVASLPDVEFAF